jgi:hypothetical protein
LTALTIIHADDQVPRPGQQLRWVSIAGAVAGAIAGAGMLNGLRFAGRAETVQFGSTGG